MVKKRPRTLTVEMPGGPDLEVAVNRILVPPGTKIDLAKDYDPGDTASYKDKQAAGRKLAANVQALAECQEMLYAQAAYEDMLRHTSTEWAPWYVIPADKKWFTRLAVSEILVRRLKALDLAYPVVSKERRKELLEIETALKTEA